MAEQLLKILHIPLLRMPRALRTIMALALRETSTSYGRSAGGYLWAVLEPVAGIALLTFIFSLGFHAPPIGISFALFYASGLVPFLIYADLSGKISQAINFSLPLLSYPRVTLADAVLARALLNMLTQLVVFCVVMGGLLTVLGTNARINTADLALAVLLAFSLGFGVGVFNCYLVTRYGVWQRVWSILNRPMFLLSCVVFTFESIPQPYRDWLWFNPIVHVVGLMRKGLYFGYDGAYVSITYVIFLSLFLSVAGFFLLWRFRDALLNR